MQEFPHGLPLVQCGFFVSAPPPLRQELIKDLRASPVIPVACALQSFMRCCCGESWALAGIARAGVIAIAINKRATVVPPAETGTGSLTDHQRHRSTIDLAKPNSARKAVVGSAFSSGAAFAQASISLPIFSIRSLGIERIELQCDSLHEICSRL